MSLADRIGRSLFVALAVGLAWGIRGDFGHLVGAMYPGAVLAMALAYVSGQRSLFLWMPVIAAASALAFGGLVPSAKLEWSRAVAIRGATWQPVFSLSASEYVGMSAGPGKVGGFVVHRIDHDPIWLDMAVSESLPIPRQRMVPKASVETLTPTNAVDDDPE